MPAAPDPNRSAPDGRSGWEKFRDRLMRQRAERARKNELKAASQKITMPVSVADELRAMAEHVKKTGTPPTSFHSARLTVAGRHEDEVTAKFNKWKAERKEAFAEYKSLNGQLNQQFQQALNSGRYFAAFGLALGDLLSRPIRYLWLLWEHRLPAEFRSPAKKDRLPTTPGGLDGLLLPKFVKQGGIGGALREFGGMLRPGAAPQSTNGSSAQANNGTLTPGNGPGSQQSSTGPTPQAGPVSGAGPTSRRNAGSARTNTQPVSGGRRPPSGTSNTGGPSRPVSVRGTGPATPDVA